MATQTAEPIAFICTACSNTNCTTSLETDRNIPCRVCGVELTPPTPSPENIRLGYAFIEQFTAQSNSKSANPASTMTADVKSSDANETIEAPEPKPLVYKATQKREYAKPGPEAAVCSIWKRLFANLVDSFVFMFLFGISFGLFTAMLTPQANQIPPMALVALFALPTLFFIVNWVMTAMDGRTIGKYALGIKIVNNEGNPPGFVHGVVLRGWVTMALQTIPFFGLIDVCAIFTNDSNRCVHDFIAGTFVIDAE